LRVGRRCITPQHQLVGLAQFGSGLDTQLLHQQPSGAQVALHGDVWAPARVQRLDQYRDQRLGQRELAGKFG